MTPKVEFSVYYEVAGHLCFCKDIPGLFEAFAYEYMPKDWRLFINSSNKSLNAVLLHSGNLYPFIRVSHSTQLKEDYGNVKELFTKIGYEEHQWDVCRDFKMIGFLLGLQGGYTKYSCFLCLWDSRAAAQHYRTVQWPLCTTCTREI